MQFHSFSNRPVSLAGSRQPPRRGAGNRQRRPSSPVKRTLFHAPSFSAGVVMGAVVVLSAAYLPEFMGSGPSAAEPQTAAAAEAPPRLTFEFDDLLRNSRVIADPEPYRSEPQAPPGQAQEIMLQAASFRSREDAERLRAALLLMDLPAATEARTLSSGHWYRVTVGPFDTPVQAQRALTQLREKDIAAIRINR
jgi:hypothetical protein